MAFTKKMMGFPSDLVSFLTKLPSKRHEKIPVTFFTGTEQNYVQGDEENILTCIFIKRLNYLH